MPIMTPTMPTTGRTTDTHHDDHDLLIAQPWGAQGGTLAQVMDDHGVVNGRPVNATASALLGRAVHGPVRLGPGALLDAKQERGYDDLALHQLLPAKAVFGPDAAVIAAFAPEAFA
jgi:hypothetical protein